MIGFNAELKGLPASSSTFFFILWTSSDEADRWPTARRTRKTRGGNGKAKKRFGRGAEKSQITGEKEGTPLM